MKYLCDDKTETNNNANVFITTFVSPIISKIYLWLS